MGLLQGETRQGEGGQRTRGSIEEVSAAWPLVMSRGPLSTAFGSPRKARRTLGISWRPRAPERLQRRIESPSRYGMILRIHRHLGPEVRPRKSIQGAQGAFNQSKQGARVRASQPAIGYDPEAHWEGRTRVSCRCVCGKKVCVCPYSR